MSEKKVAPKKPKFLGLVFYLVVSQGYPDFSTQILYDSVEDLLSDYSPLDEDQRILTLKVERVQRVPHTPDLIDD